MTNEEPLEDHVRGVTLAVRATLFLELLLNANLSEPRDRYALLEAEVPSHLALLLQGHRAVRLHVKASPICLAVQRLGEEADSPPAGLFRVGSAGIQSLQECPEVATLAAQGERQ